MKKKALAFALALCMVIAMLPATVFAADHGELLTKLTAGAPIGRVDAPTVDPNAKSYTVKLTGGSHGMTELLVSSTAQCGEVIRFLADPDDGYMAEITVTGTETGLVEYLGLDMYWFAMPESNVTIDVRYVATIGKQHDVNVRIGKGGRAALHRTSAALSESIYLSVLPDDQEQFRPEKDVVAYRPLYYVYHPVSYVKLHYLYMDEDTGEHWYEMYMPDDDVEICIFFNNGTPLKVTPTVDFGPESCEIKIEPENPRPMDLVTVSIDPAGGYWYKSLKLEDSVFKSEVDIQEYGGEFRFIMPPYDVDFTVRMTRYGYPVNATTENGFGGEVSVNKQYPPDYCEPGSTVTLRCTPDEGYRLAQITGCDKLVKSGEDTYTFTMPERAVDLRVKFLRNENPFVDVNETHFFYTPVLWAVGEGITSGISATEFGPTQICNRAQVVTFLWRAAGCPEPKISKSVFTDVQKGSWYEKAVLWAVETGITSGISATQFGPTRDCNRAQVVTFLWRLMDQPTPGLTAHPFTDVEAGGWYEKAVLWAMEKGITAGATATTFSPNGKCQRAQVVTFLYRTENGKEPRPLFPVGKLTIHTRDYTTVYAGESLQIDYTYTSEKSALTWVSKDPSLLTVDSNGKVTAVGSGPDTVWIDVYHGAKRLTGIPLWVEERPEPTEPPVAQRIVTTNIEGPYLDGTIAVVGNHTSLRTWAKTDGEERQDVIAVSTDPSVARVAEIYDAGLVGITYKISFVGPGTCEIILTSADGNVSESYQLRVSSAYSTPIGRRLTPEQFVTCVNGIMAENDAKIATDMGWRLVVLKPDELTGNIARGCAEDWVREFWGNGIRYMGLAYQGINEDGDHIFYIHR